MMTGSPGVLASGPSALHALGVTRLLSKPFSAEELAGAIAGELAAPAERGAR